MDEPKYKLGLGFTDLLFNMLIGFVMLFFLAFLLINPAKNIKPSSEYIIVIDWPKHSETDVDLHASSSAGDIINWRQPTSALMHLDRDDRGLMSDTIIIDGKKSEKLLNQEILNIRQKIDVHIIVNVHIYSIEDEPAIPETTIIVKVRLISLHPFKILKERMMVFFAEDEEQTAFDFKMNQLGIYDINTKFTSIVQKRNTIILRPQDTPGRL